MESFLVRRPVEIKVLNYKWTVVQVKRPFDRRPFPEFARQADFEPVLPERRKAVKVQARVSVDRDESTARLEAGGDPSAHRPEFSHVHGVVEQVGGDRQVEVLGQSEASSILDKIVDAKWMRLFL